MAVVAVMLSPFVSGEARAQPKSSEEAAQLSYNEAVALMGQGRFADACPKLVWTIELKPDALGARVALGTCYKGQGLYASSWNAYKEAEAAAEKAGNSKRLNEAREAAAALSPKLSTMTIVVPDTLRSLPGLTIKRQGIVVKSEDWGAAVPVDGGTYYVHVTAAGKRPYVQGPIDIASSDDRRTITIEPLTDAAPEAIPTTSPSSPPPPVPIAAPAVIPTAAPSSPPPPEPDTSVRTFWTVQRRIGLGVALAGTAGAATGLVFGQISRGKRDDSHENGHCINGNECDDVGFVLQEQAVAAGNVSTGLVIAGGALMAVGGVLFATAKSSATSKAVKSATITLGPRGALLHGTW